jgi:hypothetical protein
MTPLLAKLPWFAPLFGKEVGQAPRRAFLQERGPRVRFVSLPKHPSWRNQREIVFGRVLRKASRRGSFPSGTDLQDQRVRFLADFHEVFAKAFRWTFPARPLQTGGREKPGRPALTVAGKERLSALVRQLGHHVSAFPRTRSWAKKLGAPPREPHIIG